MTFVTQNVFMQVIPCPVRPLVSIVTPSMAGVGNTFRDMTTNNKNNDHDDTLAGLPQGLAVAQVAKHTNLCTKTIIRRIQDGTLRATRLGPRSIRIERESVIEWLTGRVA